MVQRQGGPCAVIAPVQAFILKTIITETHGHSFGDVRTFISLYFFFYVNSVYCAFPVFETIPKLKKKETKNINLSIMSPLFHRCDIFSPNAQCDSLHKIAKPLHFQRVSIVDQLIGLEWRMFEGNSNLNDILSSFSFQLTTDKCKSLLVQAICNILMKCKDDRYRIVYIKDQRETAVAAPPMSSASNPEESDQAEEATNAAESSTDEGPAIHSDSVLDWSPDEFHERLSIHNFENIDDVERYYSENYHCVSGNYGVLLFMYTVLMTKVRCRPSFEHSYHFLLTAVFGFHRN